MPGYILLKDINCPAVESAERFIEQDKSVISSGNESTFLDINTYADNKKRVLVIKKSLINLNDSTQGIASQSIELEEHIAHKILIQLKKLDPTQNITSKQYANYFHITPIEASKKLSKKELEVLIQLAYGKSAKQIAVFLKRSPRTIEAHLDNMKNKLGLHSRSELIHYACKKGYVKIIPPEFIENIF